MGTLNVFDHISLDGFFTGPNGEMEWFKSIGKDEAYDRYKHRQANSGGTLLFGRTTYEMMKSYWPTPQAYKDDPDMARVMNESPKVVVSKSLKGADGWKNVSVVHDIDEVAALKEKSDVTILGSGTLVQQLANRGLIDSYMLVLVPVVLGQGKPLFDDVKKTNLELGEAKPFDNGIVVLNYQPA